MLKVKLEQLNTLFSSLKEKIERKLESNQQALTETTQKLNESNHKLELQLKENSENEKVLETLLKEFKELIQQL